MKTQNNKTTEEKKQILLEAVGKVIKAQRNSLKTGINKFSYEYEIGNGLLSRLENGNTDTKISTLWKLSNAFNINFSDMAKLIENELPEDFNFYE